MLMVLCCACCVPCVSCVRMSLRGCVLLLQDEVDPPHHSLTTTFTNTSHIHNITIYKTSSFSCSHLLISLVNYAMPTLTACRHITNITKLNRTNPLLHISVCKYVTSQKTSSAIKQGLPNTISQREAVEKFTSWADQLWFAPKGIKNYNNKQ